MIYRFLTAAFSSLFLFCQTLSAQHAQANIPGDFADPSIIRAGNVYYATGTSSEWAPHFPIFKSANLRDWEQTGFLFDEAPAWTSASFWAPEYYYHNNTYFVYYTARRKSDGVSCIGVATSRYPDRGFKDHGVIIEYGKEAIDAFVFNDNGQLYITWKAYGLDKRPIEILGSKLSADGLSLEGETFSLLKDEQGTGIEGQSILKKDGYYYLFYSAGACCGRECSYNVRVARAASIRGPYHDYTKNPVLEDRPGWKCSGHGTFVQDAEGKQFYIYHAYNKTSHVFTGREAFVAALGWTEGQWPAFHHDPSLDNNKPADRLYTDFGKERLFWQWDFRNMQLAVTRKRGALHLSGKYGENNPSGIALTLRPYSASYEISTSVQNNNGAAKGLVIYGDAKAATGIAVRNSQVECWMVKDGKRTVLHSAQVTQPEAPVQLKMAVSPDFTCRVYWKQQGSWQALGTSYDINFLPPWDRSPRPGLSFLGTPAEKAVFSFFEIKYNAKP